jgi:hypothetical protein
MIKITLGQASGLFPLFVYRGKSVGAKHRKRDRASPGQGAPAEHRPKAAHA